MALTTNLVSYWKLDESSGNAADSVGANTLTNTSVTYGSSYGKINNGASFNGSSSILQNTSPSGIPSGSTARTVNVWIKPSAVTSTSGTYAVYWGTGATREVWLVGINSTGHPTVAVYADDLTSTQTLTVGTWYMLTAVYDGNVTLSLYINGTLDSTHTLAAPLNTIISAQGMALGNWAGTSDWYNGAEDEVGIWSRALTSTEVTQLYNGGAGLQYPFSAPSSFIPSPAMHLRQLM